MSKSSVIIDTSDLTRMLIDLETASAKTVKMVDQTITKLAYKIDSDVKHKIQKGARSGKTYKRGNRYHKASAEGEAPKTDTGRLVSSIRPVTSFMAAEVGSLSNVAKYGGMLEEGTRNMAARPVFEPTLKENEPFIAKQITSAINLGGLAS